MNTHKIYALATAWLVLMLTATTALAVPARKGIWQTLTLADGTTVLAELHGDEHSHYWTTADGTWIARQGHVYNTIKDLDAWKAQGRSRMARSRQANTTAATRRKGPQPANYTGQKRGLIILVEFSNMKFRAGHNRAFYERVANEEGFTTSDGFRGSVRDYFLAQSGHRFDVTFDVVGPVPMQNSYQYYGKNEGEYDEDAHAGEMVATACQMVDDEVDFSAYDWDGDDMVDMVMVIYAGKGEADGGSEDTIWPHEYELYWSDYGRTLTLDGKGINTYACVNEMAYRGVEGIGTLCHEFSHCLGLPDMYDLYGDNYGMGSWSLMSMGSYNGGGFCPAGYTSFEKMSCGWGDPVVLTANTTVADVQPLANGGEFFLLPARDNDDEYYLIENRQPTGWDRSLPGKGLLILHVDYDKAVWYMNEVNSTDPDETQSGNDHQRCTIFHANGNRNPWDEAGAAYPFLQNNRLTAISTPAATLFNPAGGSEPAYMDKAVTDITQHADGTMAFAIGPQQYQTDAIGRQPAAAPPGNAPVHDLSGRRLAGSLDTLKPGIYIVNGQKVLK